MNKTTDQVNEITPPKKTSQTISHKGAYQSPAGQKPVYQSPAGQNPPIQAKQRPVQLQKETTESKPQQNSNNTGLPNQLKTGIEHLSGYSMDDVKVHHNSDKPAQLQAHAYAQGTNIHLAAGQERHLPHEAWHVVQQKQGRVKPTMQMKGKVGVNDDTLLEREADMMGAKALQVNNEAGGGAKQASTSTGEGTVQRVKEWSNKADKKLDGFVDGLDDIVNAMCETVINAPLAIPNVDGYIKRFKEMCKAVVADYHIKFNKLQDKEDSKEKNQGIAIQQALKDTPFLHAAFGYAVESLTNLKLSSGTLDGKLSQGQHIVLQATRGGTRPDIVVQDGSNKDIGWFDITASDSKDHIFDKSGSGWSTRPYVAEVTYPSLTIGKIVKMIGAAAGAKIDVAELEEALKARETEKTTQIGKLHALVKLSLDAVDHYAPSKRAKHFEENLGTLMGLKDSDGGDLKLAPAVAKGLIGMVVGVGVFNGMSYAKIALAAGYKGAKQQGRNTEKALDLLYTL